MLDREKNVCVMHPTKVCCNGCDSPPYQPWRNTKSFFADVFFELNNFSVFGNPREDSIVLDRMSLYNIARAILIGRKTAFGSRLSLKLSKQMLESLSCIAHSEIEEFLGAATSRAALLNGFIASSA